MLTNPRDAFMSVKVTKHSTIPYVRYIFLIEIDNNRWTVYGFLLVFFGNFVPKTHRF